MIKRAKARSIQAKKVLRSSPGQPPQTARAAGDTHIPTPLISEMPLWARPGYLLRRLHQIHYALFYEECSEYDITPVQYGLLTTLAVNPDLDQNSIGRELGIDRTNVADVLKRLSRRGLIERRPSKEDRRMVLCRLTPEGQRVRKAMYAAMQRAQERLLEPLLPAERNAFITTLIRLVDGNNHLGRTIFRPNRA
jgi:DNA-binding MarR family transcriptional regulator